MKKLFALFATATMIFAAGCGENMDDVNPDKPNQGQEQPNNPEPDLPYDTLHLSANNEDSPVHHIWNNNDQISVFNKTDGNECWKFKKNTNNQGTFYKISGIPGTKINKVIALYPYDSDCTIKGNMINTDFPTVQTHEDNYYNEFGATVLMAVSNDDNLQFQNISCWIELGLTDDIERRSVKQIVLRGNNNEILAGNIDIDINSQKIYRKDNSGSCITFNCENKVQLSNIPKYFYIAVVPQSFIKGISVSVIMDDGTSFEKSFEDSFTITCNQCKTFNASGFQQDNSTISYTTTSGGAIELTTTDGFGASFVSHTYKNGLGVIQFDGNITSIPEKAFYSTKYLKGIYIPDSVTSIGNSAFYDCSNLTSITIPDSVTSIEKYAFYDCSNLESVTIGDSVTSIEKYAFYDCSSLTSVIIGSNVTYIGDYNFYSYYRGLNRKISVYCKPITPPQLGRKAFDEDDSGWMTKLLYVPIESVELYKRNWGYSFEIFGYSF